MNLEQRCERPTNSRPPKQVRVDVFVLGAGLSGIVMLKKLREAGITNVLACDKASGVGGTWHWNKYPGAACDVDSYSYLPFLHEMKFCPSKKYVTAQEIKGYLERLCSHYQLNESILLETKLESARYDEATSIWHITTDRNDEIESKFLIMGCGPLSTPRLPDLPGMGIFTGQSFHTSQVS